MLIRNVLAALPGEKDFRKVDIAVSGGKIREIVEAEASAPDSGSAGGAAGEALDASGLMAFPGAIDPHVHFDEPGFTHREDFAHGTAEAARGGVTTVVDMPCTSLPPITDAAALENKLSIVGKKALVDFAFFGGFDGAISTEEFERTARELAPKVVGFKCYTISGMDSFRAVSQDQLALAIRLCAEAGRPLLLHAEDPGIIAKAQTRLAAVRCGKASSWKDYYASRPMEAEIKACSTAVAAAGGNAAFLHIVHAGTAEAAALVAATGATCETCAHYLAFDEEDFERLGPALKTAPPVKEPSQKALLWRLLAEGKISFLTSDHAGAPDSEKFTGDPLTAYGGIPGTGTLFPYLLSEGLFAKRLNLPRFLEASSGGAARRYGLDGAKGALAPGYDADIVLVDPEAVTTIDPARMFSKSHITPFAGMRFAGRIAGTFVRGSCVFGSTRLLRKEAPGRITEAKPPEDGKILAEPGSGRFLTWGYR
ncbi:MAG: amidohydrolase family protein [Spirochaetes bacterium]|nr:amidohydrolase family protein [Spirochaetota bacterium]